MERAPTPLAGALTRTWMRTLLRNPRTLILDTETTDLHGQICEIAIIDTTGHVHLNTLVRPTCSITPGAHAVHGITDSDVATAPTWPHLWPTISWLLTGRTIIAYNAPYDRARLASDCSIASITPGNITQEHRWVCAMRARASIERSRWRRLDAGHRALGDAQATLALMRRLVDLNPHH